MFSCLLASTKIKLMPILIVHCTLQSSLIMPSKLWCMRICRCPQSSISTINCVHFEPGDMTMTIMNDGPTNICIREASDKWSQICRNAVTVPGHTSCRQTPLPGILTRINFRENGWPLEINWSICHLTVYCDDYIWTIVWWRIMYGWPAWRVDIDNNEKSFIVF